MVQHNLFLVYVLSTKPIPGIHFVHKYYAGQLIWFNIANFWHMFCQSVKPGVFRTKKKIFRNETIDCFALFSAHHRKQFWESKAAFNERTEHFLNVGKF